MLFIQTHIPSYNQQKTYPAFSTTKLYNTQFSLPTITQTSRSHIQASASSQPQDPNLSIQPFSQDPCPVCSGTGTLPCTLCNAQGFLKVNQNTVWRTCHICIARGKIVCRQCQGPDAKLPPAFTD